MSVSILHPSQLSPALSVAHTLLRMDKALKSIAPNRNNARSTSFIVSTMTFQPDSIIPSRLCLTRASSRFVQLHAVNLYNYGLQDRVSSAGWTLWMDGCAINFVGPWESRRPHALYSLYYLSTLRIYYISE